MNETIEHRVVNFLKELLHPEGLGWAVTSEVHRQARDILIMIESEKNEQDSTIRQTA